MSGYDNLERQLRESVRARRASARRRRSRRGGLLALIAVVAVGGGVATAAQLTGGTTPRHDKDDAHRAARRAIAEAADDPACVRPEPSGPHAVTPAGTVPYGTLNPSLRGLFPPLAPDAEADAEAAKQRIHGPVIAGTPRLIHAADGLKVLLYVTRGDRGDAPRDPAACAAARSAHLARDRPDPTDPVRVAAQRELDTALDTLPGLELVWISAGGGGAGIPVGHGHPLPAGLVASGGERYLGLAAPGARTVTLRGARVHRTIPVKARVFAFKLGRGTGAVTLRQRAADGRVLAHEVLRR